METIVKVELKDNPLPKSRIPLKWQKGSGIQKQQDGLSFFDYFSMLLIILSLAEWLLYNSIVVGLTGDKLVSQKPTWVLVTIIVLWLNPYKNYLYLATFIIGSIWIISRIYQEWHKKQQIKEV